MARRTPALYPNLRPASGLTSRGASRKLTGQAYPSNIPYPRRGGLALTISALLTTFAGTKVKTWTPKTKIRPDRYYRIGIEYDEESPEKGVDPWVYKFRQFLADPDSRTVTGVVVGAWSDMQDGEMNVQHVVKALAEAAPQLPAVCAIMLGDITYEECEISWINQTNVMPILKAYPQLEHFGVRGGEKLELPKLQHDTLKTLIVEAGGLPREVVRQVARARLPALEHLELWLGVDEYGGDATVADLQPIIQGERFPRLRHLGLRDSALTDEIAVAVAQSPILERLEGLDLSLGTLGDTGAAALLQSPGVRHLKTLDLHHHFCSDAMMEQLKALPLDVNVDEQEAPDEDDGEEHRYVAVSE